MKSKPASPSQPAVDSSHADAARAELCRRVAAALHGGSVRLRVRLEFTPENACFYEHRENAWHKQGAMVADALAVQALHEQLDILASKPRGDDLQVTRHAVSGGQEIELHFRGEHIKSRLQSGLDSYVRGLLFGDHHDSRQDVRRQMNRGPQHSK